MECSGLSLDAVPERSVHASPAIEPGEQSEACMAAQRRRIRSKAKRTAKAAKTPSSALSKQQRMIEMLGRPEGATITQLGEALGWQAHSVRGAISSALKKKLGLKVISDKDAGGDRLYRIV